MMDGRYVRLIRLGSGVDEAALIDLFVLQVVGGYVEEEDPQDGPLRHPSYTGSGSDHVFLTLTLMVLFERKVARIRMSSEQAPFLAKARRQCWKLTY